MSLYSFLVNTSNQLTTVDISVMLTPCFGDIDPPCSKWFKEQTA
jgi:hypothetical protein